MCNGLKISEYEVYRLKIFTKEGLEVYGRSLHRVFDWGKKPTFKAELTHV